MELGEETPKHRVTPNKKEVAMSDLFLLEEGEMHASVIALLYEMRML